MMNPFPVNIAMMAAATGIVQMGDKLMISALGNEELLKSSVSSLFVREGPSRYSYSLCRFSSSVRPQFISFTLLLRIACVYCGCDVEESAAAK